AVRNFTWKLEGRGPDNEYGYYGGLVKVFTDFGFYEDMEDIELTLVPDGPLIDGSEGRTLVLRLEDHYWVQRAYLEDIPIGRYTITATLRSAEGTRALRIQDWHAKGDFKPGLRFDFIPDSTSSPGATATTLRSSNLHETASHHARHRAFHRRARARRVHRRHQSRFCPRRLRHARPARRRLPGAAHRRRRRIRGLLGPGHHLPERRPDDRLGLPRDGRRRHPGHAEHARRRLLRPGRVRRARVGQRRAAGDRFEVMRPTFPAASSRRRQAGLRAAESRMPTSPAAAATPSAKEATASGANAFG